MSATLYPAETNAGTVTSFIPLTTAWPSSSGCGSYFRLDGPSLMAYDPGYGLAIDTNVICAPPAVTTWWEQGLLDGGNQYHTAVSIGPMTCPEAFSTVVTSVKDGISTLAMCCPSGYDLVDGIPGQVEGRCLSTVSSGATLTYASTPYGDSTAWKTATTTLSQSSTVGAIGVVGWNIKFATPASTSTSTSVTSTSTSAGPDTTSETAAPSATSSSSAAGLTTGAKVGIGVGVGVGGVGAIALFVALYTLLRRRKEAVPNTPVHYSQQQPAWPSELPGSAKPTPSSPAELGG
ncbi:hypothetical protein CDV55_106432 [Aspergillus turcosus]|uniref:Mid2 domain-containing protein n=1 Tax=Aspergillus turcosus TaxID=1245748 RepID=A0A229Z2F9_9EURO|nr:hypothetical protein CDV55_106432 [Aspergillus turcosus]RLL98206.1 hypothetical protein CFD26_106607 [Aspergillus turcosus]